MEKITVETAIAQIRAAQEVAARHTKAYLEQHGDGYPCGFAWVNIKPARGIYVKAMKEMGVGRADEYYGGYTVWNPSENFTQNMYAKEEGARAFATELQKLGLKATAASRMD